MCAIQMKDEIKEDKDVGPGKEDPSRKITKGIPWTAAVQKAQGVSTHWAGKWEPNMFHQVEITIQKIFALLKSLGRIHDKGMEY